jgi:hypothetical protein
MYESPEILADWLMLTATVSALTDSAQPNPTAPAIQLIYALFTLLISSIFNFIALNLPFIRRLKNAPQ